MLPLLKGKVHDLSNGKNRVPIHGMTLKNLPDIAAVLISGGADANTLDGDGWSPLHMAAFVGSKRMMEVLMENFADPSLRGPDGCTVAHLAAEGDHADILDWLVQNGADVDMRDDYGRSPLWYACYLGRMNSVVYLVDRAQCDVGQTDNLGCTPLHIAALMGRHKMCMFLVSQNASPNERNYAGLRPLEAACIGGNLETVKFLADGLNTGMLANSPIANAITAGFKHTDSSARDKKSGFFTRFMGSRISNLSSNPLDRVSEGGARSSQDLKNATSHGELPPKKTGILPPIKRSIEFSDKDEDEAETPAPGKLNLPQAPKSLQKTASGHTVNPFASESSGIPSASTAAGSNDSRATRTSHPSRMPTVPSISEGATEGEPNKQLLSPDGSAERNAENGGADDDDRPSSSGSSAGFALPMLKSAQKPKAAVSFRGINSAVTNDPGSAGHSMKMTINVVPSKSSVAESQGKGLTIRVDKRSTEGANPDGANTEGRVTQEAFDYMESDPLAPLHCAAANGHIDVVRYLCEELQADVNEVRADNITALHLACAAENRTGMITGLADYLKTIQQNVTAAATAAGKSAAAAAAKAAASAQNQTPPSGGGAPELMRKSMSEAPPPSLDFSWFHKRDLAWWLPVRLGIGSMGSPVGLADGDGGSPATGRSADGTKSKGGDLTRAASTVSGWTEGDAVKFPWNFPTSTGTKTSHAAVIKYLLERGADPWVKSSSRGIFSLHIVADHLKGVLLEELMLRYSEDDIRILATELPTGSDFVSGLLIDPVTGAVQKRVYEGKKRQGFRRQTADKNSIPGAAIVPGFTRNSIDGVPLHPHVVDTGARSIRSANVTDLPARTPSGGGSNLPTPAGLVPLGVGLRDKSIGVGMTALDPLSELPDEEARLANQASKIEISNAMMIKGGETPPTAVVSRLQNSKPFESAGSVPSPEAPLTSATVADIPLTPERLGQAQSAIATEGDYERMFEEMTEQLEHYKKESRFYKTQFEIVQVKRKFLEDMSGRLETERVRLIDENLFLKDQLKNALATIERLQATPKSKWGIGGKSKVVPAQSIMSPTAQSNLARTSFAGKQLSEVQGQPTVSKNGSIFASQHQVRLAPSINPPPRDSHVLSAIATQHEMNSRNTMLSSGGASFMGSNNANAIARIRGTLVTGASTGSAHRADRSGSSTVNGLADPNIGSNPGSPRFVGGKVITPRAGGGAINPFASPRQGMLDTPQRGSQQQITYQFGANQSTLLEEIADEPEKQPPLPPEAPAAAVPAAPIKSQAAAQKRGCSIM